MYFLADPRSGCRPGRGVIGRHGNLSRRSRDMFFIINTVVFSGLFNACADLLGVFKGVQQLSAYFGGNFVYLPLSGLLTETMHINYKFGFLF